MLSRQCRYLLLGVTFSGLAGNLDTIATGRPLIDQSGGTQRYEEYEDSTRGEFIKSIFLIVKISNAIIY